MKELSLRKKERKDEYSNQMINLDAMTLRQICIPSKIGDSMLLVLKNLQLSSSTYMSSGGVLQLMGYKATEVESSKPLRQTIGCSELAQRS